MKILKLIQIFGFLFESSLHFRNFRFVSAIFTWLANVGHALFWRVMSNLRELAQPIRPCRGPLAARSRPPIRRFQNAFAFLHGAKHSYQLQIFSPAGGSIRHP